MVSLPLQGAVCRRRRVAQKPAAVVTPCTVLRCNVARTRLSIEWLLTRPLLFPNVRGINFSKPRPSGEVAAYIEKTS